MSGDNLVQVILIVAAAITVCFCAAQMRGCNEQDNEAVKVVSANTDNIKACLTGTVGSDRQTITTEMKEIE